jgi:hypothetical protein
VRERLRDPFETPILLRKDDPMNDLARELKVEGDALQAVCGLLASKASFSDWPPLARSAG